MSLSRIPLLSLDWRPKNDNLSYYYLPYTDNLISFEDALMPAQQTKPVTEMAAVLGGLLDLEFE